MGRIRHVVVTGGGTGVGAAIARRFADDGARVTVMGRRRAPLQATGLPCQLCDVTDEASVIAAFDQARNDQGPIHLVVANAGAAASQPFHKMSSADLGAMLDVNLVGVFNAFRHGMADMQQTGWGRMIAIASTASLKGYAYVSGYCAAKHGVIGLVRALAMELARTDITVNAICPGYVDTPMLDRSVANIVEKTGMSSEEARKLLMANNPQKRFIQPDEVAAMALWLSSETAASINGQAIGLTGGEV